MPPMSPFPSHFGPMFHDDTDLNGVDVSTNAHPVSDYEPRRIKSQFPHGMWSDEEGRYVEAPARQMDHAVKDQVLTHIGNRTGTMTFESELAVGTPADDQRMNGLGMAVPVSRSLPTKRSRKGK